MIAKIKLGAIIADKRAQARVKIDEATVSAYVEAMNDGAVFPPIVVFGSDAEAWLADGAHRVKAAELRGDDEIDAVIRPGGLREAMLHAVGANATHGLRRTSDDKRKAILVLLADPEWSRWSDREIARQCSVSQDMVSRARHRLSDRPGHIDDSGGDAPHEAAAPPDDPSPPPVRIARRGNQQYQMRMRAPTPHPAPDPVPPAQPPPKPMGAVRTFRASYEGALRVTGVRPAEFWAQADTNDRKHANDLIDQLGAWLDEMRDERDRRPRQPRLTDDAPSSDGQVDDPIPAAFRT